MRPNKASETDTPRAPMETQQPNPINEMKAKINAKQRRSCYMARSQLIHQQIIEHFSQIAIEKLNLPSTIWESTLLLIRHKLQQEEEHLAQHTVKTEQTWRCLKACSANPGYASRSRAMDEEAILSTSSYLTVRTTEVWKSM